MTELRMNSAIRAMHYGGVRSLESITAIVFHYTANQGTSASALGNARYFASGSDGRKASAHYIVDEGDVAYECVPLDRIAWAVGDGSGGTMGKLINNTNSVSIEMVSHTKDGVSFIPEKTMVNAGRLYRMLLKKLPNVKYIARHYDVSRKLCPLPLMDAEKWDAFQKEVREGLDMTKDELLSTKGTGDNPSAWAKEATDWAKKNKIFNGDATGGYGWQQPITREAMAQVLYHFAKSIAVIEPQK